jgi:peptidoglycan/xylan/chitin deacetylase (PgdA/CDA1 family)
MEALDKCGMRGSVTLNSSVCEHYPIIVEEGKKRNWEFLGHGITNSRLLNGLSEEDERKVIRETVQTITKTVGKAPQGWLGPALAETFVTPDLLAEEGIRYLCDWCNDDQPYPMKVKAGKMISIPYCMEINDIPLYMRKGYTGEQYFRSVMDQFETLYDDSVRQPRVMGIPLHPMISGQPLRIKYLRRALAEMKQHERVWFATGSEIIDAYEKAQAGG